jgi:hypothetical protein
MFPVRYELGFYISQDGILHSHRREHHKSNSGYDVLSLGINGISDFVHRPMFYKT